MTYLLSGNDPRVEFVRTEWELVCEMIEMRSDNRETEIPLIPRYENFEDVERAARQLNWGQSTFDGYFFHIPKGWRVHWRCVQIVKCTYKRSWGEYDQTFEYRLPYD